MILAPARDRSRRPGARRILAFVLLSSLLGIAGSTAAPESAMAAPGGLEFSRDGVTWSSAAPAALYESVPMIVPGVGRTATLHVRNGHEGAARVSAFITALTWSSDVAAEAFVLSAVDGRGGIFPDTAIGAIRDCTSLIPQRVLAPGQSVQLAVTVRMPPSVESASAMDQSMGFALALGLVDPVVPELDTCPDHPATVPAIPSAPGAAAPGTGAGWAGAPSSTGAAIEEVPEVIPDEVEPTPAETAAEWISCDLRAFASGVGMPVALCPDVFVSDGAASALMLLFILVAVVWFLLLWRRRHRDEEEDAHELSQGGVA